jgi:hypothetical protein
MTPDYRPPRRMTPTTMITAFPSVAGPQYIIVVAEPTRPIYLHQSVQTHNEMRAMEIVGIRSVGQDHLVFVSVGKAGEGDMEVEEFVVVPDHWVDVSVWRTKWWLWPKKALFSRFLKPVVHYRARS